MTAMMEKMLRDPNMQKMLYPYLPEPMRNPESIEWMLNNPEVRKQMEQVFAQSVSKEWGCRGSGASCCRVREALC
jgi:hypothetical protein